MDKVGVIHGRFQILHIGHIEYLLAGLQRCEHLYIGLCNPSPLLTSYDSTNPHRALNIDNPFTYYERYNMIKYTMKELSVPHERFDIVPFPINFPQEITNYVPYDAKFYITIYDDWGRKKLRVLRELNLNVDVMWERSISEKVTCGKEIREKINEGNEWKHLVPESVYHYVVDNDLERRVKWAFSIVS